MAESERKFAAIGAGSNLGDRQANINAAVAKLTTTPGVQMQAVSNLLENPAVGGPPDSPPFLNAAIAIQTTLPPTELLERLLEIEKSLGRDRRQKWDPRPIDLDLLLYGDAIIHQPGLVVPHPLMHQRRFVLQPLAEIAPHAMHSLFNRTVAELLAELDQN